MDYAWDALDRLDSATQAAGGVTTPIADFTYDPLDRPVHRDAGAASTKMDWTWSPGGDLVTIAHDLNATANDVTYTGGFDPAHRLTLEAISNGLYRWTAGLAGAGTYAPDKLNRYGAITPPVGPSKLMTHDGNGSVSGYGSWAYVYDAENRLVSASSGATAVSFTYDPLGRRVGKAQTAPSGSTHAYLHDGDEEVEESGASSLRWVPGAEIDRPLAEILITSANQPRILHTDRRGSVVVVGRLDGVKLEGPYSYDAYGLPSATTGTAVKYTGRRYDPETGLYYYRARYYDPATGRFWQTDPIGYEGGMNLYGYVQNNPINATDPTGEILDIIADAVFVIVDVVDIAVNGANPINTAALGADVAATFVPIATGAGLVVRAGAKGAEVAQRTEKVASSARAARREAMREAKIPTSQQPSRQGGRGTERWQEFDTPKRGGGTERKAVVGSAKDISHKGQQHFEAGRVKVNPRTREVRSNEYGAPKLSNDKCKVGVSGQGPC